MPCTAMCNQGVTGYKACPHTILRENTKVTRCGWAELKGMDCIPSMRLPDLSQSVMSSRLDMCPTCELEKLDESESKWLSLWVKVGGK